MIMRAIRTRLAPGIAALALALASGSVSAQSSSTPCTPNPSSDFVTGGGFIITPDPNTGAHANFGVAGGCKNGFLWGHLEYIDHGARLNVHWTSITAYFPDPSDSSKARYICGTARTNLYGNVDFIVRARDTAEPGTNDVFDIRLTQPQGNPPVNVIVYSTEFSGFHKLNGGNGGGGNIELHGPTTGDFGGPCPALFVGA